MCLPCLVFVSLPLSLSLNPCLSLSPNPLHKDILGGSRISTCKDLSKPCLTSVTQQQCCGNCSAIGECKVWVYDPNAQNCWLMQNADATVSRADRNCGGDIGSLHPTGVSATVSAPDGTVLWNITDLDAVSQNLVWPSPLAAKAYAVKDYPRFHCPKWGPTPPPTGTHIDPALVETNGFDFRNNQTGDVYVFMLGSSIDDWHKARAEFIHLAGPTPLVPDYTFGTWFTYWHPYTEDEAKGEIERWDNDSLPIDVWALDMNCWLRGGGGGFFRFRSKPTQQPFSFSLYFAKGRDSPHQHQPGYKDGMNH